MLRLLVCVSGGGTNLQAIFDAILETTSAHYQKDTAEISVHVQDSQKDIPVFSHISEELLVEKVMELIMEVYL